MKRDLLLLIVLILYCGAIGACSKQSPPAADRADTSLSDVFTDFWDRMNTGYVWWDKDTTDWDEVYRRYQPLFAKLDIHRQQDVSLAAGYFTEMTRGLIDAHYSINMTTPLLRGVTIFPALDQKTLSSNWHGPFPYVTLDTTYLDKGYTYGSWQSSDGQRISALSGTIMGKILYFGCDGFALSEAYHSSAPNEVKAALSAFFLNLDHPSAAIHAIILDVRSNPGGNVVDLGFLMGHLTAQRVVFGSTRYKGGSARLDYTPWIDAAVDPSPDSTVPHLPLIVLADSHSISLAEAVVMVVKNMPSGIFVGETTWGATGPVASASVYNAGSYDLPGILSVTASSAQFRYIDGKTYEGKGFAPDLPVAFDLVSLNKGKDAALEKAISLAQ